MKSHFQMLLENSNPPDRIDSIKNLPVQMRQLLAQAGVVTVSLGKGIKNNQVIFKGDEINFDRLYELGLMVNEIGVGKGVIPATCWCWENLLQSIMGGTNDSLEE